MQIYRYVLIVLLQTTLLNAMQEPQAQAILTLLQAALLHAPAADKSAPFHQPITINVAVDAHSKTAHVSSQASTMEQSANQAAESSATNETTSSFSDELAAFQKKIKTLIGEQTSSWYTTIMDHPYRTIFLSALLCYCILWLMNTRDHYYFDDPQRWSAWRHEMPLEELCTRNQQAVLEELHEAICYRYLNPLYPDDLAIPRSRFMVDITQEIERAERYITRINCVRSCHLGWFVPNYANLITTKLARAKYLKRLFVQWLMQQHTVSKEALHAT